MRRFLHAAVALAVTAGLAYAASTFTTNMSLEKPGIGDSGWGTALNSNLDTIDAEFAKSYSGHPDGNVACDFVGQQLIDTSNDILFYCITAGVAASADWQAVTPQGSQFTDLFMTGQQIKNVGDATDDQDAVNLRQLVDRNEAYATAAGSSGAFTLTLSPALSSYVAGQQFCWKANHAVTGAATLNVNGLGAKSILKLGNEALAANDIIVDQAVCVVYDGTQFQMVSPPAGVLAEAHLPSTFRLPRGYIGGMITSQDTDTDHDINITAGEARDATNAYDLLLSSEITKQIDVDWAAGDDAGGFPSGLTLSTSTWYFVCVIGDDVGSDGDIDTVDAGFDDSSDCNDLLSDSGYEAYRVVGFVRTNGSSNITAFTQSGDTWLWVDPPLDIDNATPGTTANTATLTIPSAYKFLVYMNVADTTAGTFLYLSSLDQNDEAPSASAAPLASVGTNDANNTGFVTVRSNTSKQVRYRSSADVQVYGATLGWQWARGVND